jgi:hypothetical protein
VAGHEEGDRLVADLPVGHASPVVLVLRLEQAREKVVAREARRAPLVDQALDGLVEVGDRRAKPGPARSGEQDRRAQHLRQRRAVRLEARGDPALTLLDHVADAHLERQPRGAEVFVRPVERDGERVAEGVGLVEGVGVEERLAHDRHRDPRHLAAEIDRPPVAPAAGRPRDDVGHDADILRDDLGLEERGHQLALPPPEIALAGEETLARERVEDEPQGRRLFERARPLDEDVVRGGRRRRKKGVHPEEEDARSAGGLARRTLEEGEALRLELARVTDEWRTAREARKVLEQHARLLASERSVRPRTGPGGRGGCKRARARGPAVGATLCA